MLGYGAGLIIVNQEAGMESSEAVPGGWRHEQPRLGLLYDLRHFNSTNHVISSIITLVKDPQRNGDSCSVNSHPLTAWRVRRCAGKAHQFLDKEMQIKYPEHQIACMSGQGH